MPNGDKFTGKFENGNQHAGSFISADNQTWRMNGFGQIIYPDESIYDGDYKEGRKHGVGQYEDSKTGNIYDGEWVNNRKHGFGTLKSGWFV